MKLSLRFFLLFLLLFLFFPAQAFATTVVQDVDVNPRIQWNDTGIDIPPGSDLRIQGFGFAGYLFSEPSVPPGGKTNCIGGQTFLTPGLPCYGLVGKIDNGTPFFIGSETEFFPPNSGRLYLSMNDEVGSFGDNYGSWTAHIIYTFSPLPTPTPNTKTPLIFIPGIGGSELKTAEEVNWNQKNGHSDEYFTHTYPAHDVIWLNEPEARALGDDDYFDILRMNTDGITPQANLQLTGNIVARAYQDTIDFFTSNGYTLDQDFFVYSYDWRRNLSLTLSLLDQKIQAVKQQTGATKVDIVAHSMGGLVARNYIAETSKAQNVRKLITLGTPHLGSVKSLKTLRYGDCLTDRRLENLPFCFGLIPSEIKDVVQNMIGAYELAPTQTYYTFYSGIDNYHPLPFADLRDVDNNGVTGTLDYTQTKTLLTNLGHNTSLFSPSEIFHTIDSNLSNTNGVDVTLIAGSGIATLGQIVEKYAVNFLGIQIPKKDEVAINGDNTVPLFSASLYDPGKNHSLLGLAKIYYTNQKHGNLINPGPALNLVKNILNGDNTLPNGVSIQPFPFNGTRISVHSPVNIHAYDTLGNHTGPTTDGFEENIPGSSFETLDDAKFIYLLQSGQYIVKFDSTDQGSFDFKIRDYRNDQNNTTIVYQDIPLTNTTKAQTSLDTSNLDTPPQIALDSDGDGTTDANIPATITLYDTAASDQTPSISSYQLSEGPQNTWFKTDVILSLSATDEVDGSGVAKIEYALDDGLFQTYTNPFTISKEGSTHVKITSTDVAGNQEFPQSLDIKIDKTPPEARANFNLQNQAIEVTGVDNLSAVTVAENPSGQINLTDSAGNSTKLIVSPITVPRKTKIIFGTIQYNNNNPISLPTNELDTTLKTQPKTGQINSFSQKLTIPTQTLSASYDNKTNTTTITTGQRKQVQTVVKPGMIFLELLTNNGQLQTQY